MTSKRWYHTTDMWNITKLLNTITAKKYEGVINGNLPVNSMAWRGGDFLKANEISLYVNRALAKRAEKVGEIEFILKNKQGDVLPENDLFNLLYKPNAAMHGFQFWGLYQKWLDIFGEVYILLEGGDRGFGEERKVQAMHLLFPPSVTPEFDNTGKPTKYIFKTPNSTVDYLPEQIIYIYYPNPSRPLRGIPLLQAGTPAIQTEIQISTYHSRILENGGKVEGVFKFKTPSLTESQLVQLKEGYKKEYADAKKSGMPLFLGGDSDYTKTGLTPSELSYLEAKKMTLEDICILTGVPKAILASFDDIQYSNADTSLRVFLGETIRPLLKALTTLLDESLFPGDVLLTFVDPTPENIEAKLKETESGIKNYYITINEARERHGYDPIEGGDVIMVPFSVMPMGEEKAVVADPAKAVKATTPHPNQDPTIRKMWGKMQIKRMDAREKVFKKELTQYFTEQQERITSALEPTKTRVFRKKNLLDEILSLELEVKLGREKFIPVLRELLLQAGISAMQLAGSDYEFTITSDMLTWIDNRANVFLRTINETTLKKLGEQFQQSLDSNENREQLINRVQETYGDISKGRAGVIARTEVHNATQYGTLEGYKRAGMTLKIWVSVIDAHTRETHAMLDGEERPMDVPFSNGLMLPGDPRGSAEEVINCRCTI